MRRRFQNGCVRKSKDGRYWVGQYREHHATGKRRQKSKVLGRVSKMTKSKAQEKLADILKPINEVETSTPSCEVTVRDFVENTYLPFYRKKWKRITDMARTESITHPFLTHERKGNRSEARRRSTGAYSRRQSQRLYPNINRKQARSD